MNTRIVLIAVAIIAAGLAGYIAINLTQPVVQVTEGAGETVVERVATIDVLVAVENLAVGGTLNEETVEWKGWPEDGIVEGLIRRDSRPDAIAEMTGMIVRLPTFAGEPLRPEKLVDASSRIMSSLLPSGKRAVSTEITVATGAGGFILPNDRVDVIMTRRIQGSDGYTTEVVLSNVRVLAIDQRISESGEGGAVAVGATATLELDSEQTQIMTVAQQLADSLSLALRSVADVQEPDTGGARYLLSGEDGSAAIQVIRSGAVSTAGATN